MRSVLSATPAPSLQVHVTVICNGCTDDSREVVRRLQTSDPGMITLLEEPRRGKSRALNAGIEATSGDLVGMIDDDEEVGQHWLLVIAEAFADPRLDFIGGPYVPICDSPLPEWLPEDYPAVLGAIDNGSTPRRYGGDFPDILKGGNAVIRRRALQLVGPYAHHLGPGSFSRLFSCEDEDMHWRLLEARRIGRHYPQLVIYHYVETSRLSREYCRRWCFWRGASRGLMDRRHPLPVRFLAGIPRFLWGRAGRALLRLSRFRSNRPARDKFTDELRLWDVAGYICGRHIYGRARFSATSGRGDRVDPGYAALQGEAARPEESETRRDIQLAG